MPQKKYDLTSERGNIEKEFKTEADRQKRLDEIVNADYQQRTLPKKYKLPTFACPACHAKNIMFAGGAVAKNETVLSLLEENGIAKVKAITDIPELTPEIVLEFISRIDVYAPYRENKQRHQRIDIYSHGIGYVFIPEPEEVEEMFQEHLRDRKDHIKVKTA